MATTTFNLTVTLEFEVDGTVLGKLTKAISDVTCSEATGLQYMKVANATTDGVMSLSPLTTAYTVAIISDQVVTIKRNGSTVVHTLRANEPIVLSTVTALTITNASGSEANVQYIAVGV